MGGDVHVVHVVFSRESVPKLLPTSTVRGPIMRIFRHLHTAITMENDPDYFFSNGCGKLLLYEFLMLPTEPFYHVILSTTANPYTDW